LGKNRLTIKRWKLEEDMHFKVIGGADKASSKDMNPSQKGGLGFPA
jgi:hypothetical protein